MPNNIIVHTSDISGDGIGDLKNLLNWLKVFHRYYQGTHQQLVLIFADNYPKVEKFLLSFKKVEPNHPIFNFFSAEGSIKPKSIANKRIAVLLKSVSPMAVHDLKQFFPYVQDQDVINIFKISVSGSMLFKSRERKIDADNLSAVFEFDGLPDLVKKPTYSTLGLEKLDFGLLHDIDGVTGKENLDDYLVRLSPATKKLIFQNSEISLADAKVFLANTPIVFAYVFPLYDNKILEAVLNSPIVQTAISQELTPLFIITNMHTETALPANIMAASKTGKIRLLTTWLPPEEFEILNSILMNENTNSLIMPSGDDGLTTCIKTGKFPLYAHKSLDVLPDFMRMMLGASKTGIFKSMIKILDQDKTGWNKELGFSACRNILRYLAKDTSKIELHKFITPELLHFFRSKLSPYLMENFAFENKSLPTLLRSIKSAAPEPVLFEASKPKKEPSVEKAKPENKEAAFAGFKPGFLT